MTSAEVINACIKVAERLRTPGNIPWDTGNMATNGIAYEITQDGFHLFWQDAQAPYLPYTNEPWIAAKWNGKKNPNEGWWNKFCELFMEELAIELGGELE